MKHFIPLIFQYKLPFNFEYEGNVVLEKVQDYNEIKDEVFKMRNRKALGLSRLSTDIIKGGIDLLFPQKV